MEWKPLKIGNITVSLPIIQGGMGIGISLDRLAGAVAREGGVGTISAAQIGFREANYNKNPLLANLQAIPKYLKKAREQANGGVIGINIMTAVKNYADYVKVAAEAGADLIISGAGLPIDLPEYVKGTNTKIAPIVSSEKAAQIILKLWDRKYHRVPDLLIIEGPKAGGHLGFKHEELQRLTEEEYKNEIQKICLLIKEYEKQKNCQISVALAGGIYNKTDAEHAFSLGIDAIQIATRFVTTEECDAADNYKQAYIRCKKEEIEIVQSPVGMPGRAIHNLFLEKISQKKYKPEHCRQCLQSCNPTKTPYCITEALIRAAEGDIEHALLFCGANAYQADKIETVKEVIQSFIK